MLFVYLDCLCFVFILSRLFNIVPLIIQDVINVIQFHIHSCFYTQPHTLHCEALSKFALYNCSLGICFLLYKNFSSWFKQYKLAVQYTLTQVSSFASPGRHPVGSYIVTDDCIHNPNNISNWECETEETHYSMVLLLQQFWKVIICNLEF